MERNLQHKLDKLLYPEELMWFQRTKVQWMVDGDRNTKFHHTKAVQRRRKKVVNMIKDDEGRWIEDEERIKNCLKPVSKTSTLKTLRSLPGLIRNIHLLL